MAVMFFHTSLSLFLVNVVLLYMSNHGVTAVPVQNNRLAPMTANDFAGGKDATFNRASRNSDDKDSAKKFIEYGNVALFYVGEGFFTVILIYPYQDLLTRLINSNDVTVVNLTKVKYNLPIMLENSIDEVSSGLLKVVDTGDAVTVDLDGQYPEDMESQFKVSECLETSDGVPVANLLLLESVKYPGHYLRWYDGSKIVDCQLKQEEDPKDDVHFYWEFTLPKVTPVAEPMLPVQLQTTDQSIFEFVKKIPKLVDETKHSDIVDLEWLESFFAALTA